MADLEQQTAAGVSNIPLEDRMKLLLPNSLVEVLTNEEKLVIALKFEIARNNWNRLIYDLNKELSGGLCSSKLADKIKKDIIRIEQFREYEMKYGIDLYKMLY